MKIIYWNFRCGVAITAYYLAWVWLLLGYLVMYLWRGWRWLGLPDWGWKPVTLHFRDCAKELHVWSVKYFDQLIEERNNAS